MPIIHPTTGRVVYGFGPISVDGAEVPLGPSVSGGCWFTAHEVAYQDCSPPTDPSQNVCRLEARHLQTGVTSLLNAQIGSYLLRGNAGVWAATYPGVFTSIPGLGPFPASGLAEVTESGQVVLYTQDGRGVRVYRADGSLQLDLDVPEPRLVVCRENVLAYADVSGWHLVDVHTGQPIAFVPRESIGAILPIVLNGEMWLAEYQFALDVRSIRTLDGVRSWVIPTVGQEFELDARPFNGQIRVAYTTTHGGAADTLVLLDINAATGETRKATVFNGQLAWATGPQLHPLGFEPEPEEPEMAEVFVLLTKLEKTEQGVPKADPLAPLVGVTRCSEILHEGKYFLEMSDDGDQTVCINPQLGVEKRPKGTRGAWEELRKTAKGNYSAVRGNKTGVIVAA